MRNRFTHAFSEFPDVMPVFPLAGAVILPNGQLPLNIFEDRYLNMVLDAIAGSRLIGMVQPKGDAQAQVPELHDTGCAGRIVSFSETRDNRLLIILAGVCRFDIVKEMDMKTATGGSRSRGGVSVMISIPRSPGSIPQTLLPRQNALRSGAVYRLTGARSISCSPPNWLTRWRAACLFLRRKNRVSWRRP